MRSPRTHPSALKYASSAAVAPLEDPTSGDGHSEEPPAAELPLAADDTPGAVASPASKSTSTKPPAAKPTLPATGSRNTKQLNRSVSRPLTMVSDQEVIEFKEAFHIFDEDGSGAQQQPGSAGRSTATPRACGEKSRPFPGAATLTRLRARPWRRVLNPPWDAIGQGTLSGETQPPLTARTTLRRLYRCIRNGSDSKVDGAGSSPIGASPTRARPRLLLAL